LAHLGIKEELIMKELNTVNDMIENMEETAKDNLSKAEKLGLGGDLDGCRIRLAFAHSMYEAAGALRINFLSTQPIEDLINDISCVSTHARVISDILEYHTGTYAVEERRLRVLKERTNTLLSTLNENIKRIK
jgi:hypothetical protein